MQTVECSTGARPRRPQVSESADDRGPQRPCVGGGKFVPLVIRPSLGVVGPGEGGRDASSRHVVLSGNLVARRSDVTLASNPTGDEIRVGIRWHAGAHEEQLATRTRMLTDQDAIDLIRRRKNEDMRDTDIAAELRALGLRTARGDEFGTRDVRNVRHSIGLTRPSPLAPGELTVQEVAARLGVKPGTVY